MAETKTIQLKRLLINTTKYCRRKWHELSLFAIIHIFLIIVGFKFINGWHDKLFLLWLVPYYMFWCFFFRFYFDRKPYIMTPKIFDTLLPSTRILGLTILVTTFIVLIPLIIPFISGNSPWVDSYINHLQHLTEEDTQVINTITSLIITILSPLIFYRPMKGNYWQFLLLTVMINLLFIVIEFIDTKLSLGSWLFILFGSILAVVGNVVLAKTYEYFFLEIDK